MTLPSQIIDLTHVLDPNNISIYPEDPPLKCCPIADVASSGFSVHSLSLGTHTGTHIDSPSHFFENGSTIDQIPLDRIINKKAVIVDLTYKKADEKISWEKDLAGKMNASSINPQGLVLLLYTGWSKHWGTSAYTDLFPTLDRRTAEEFLLHGIDMIGMDTLSPDPINGPEGFAAHEVILGAGGLIVENLSNLAALVDAGAAVTEVMISIVPLNLKGCDGSPVRAFAWK